MAYCLTTVLLVLTVAGFFWWARGGMRAFGWPQWVMRVLGALPLFVSGIAHFMRTALFAGIIPPVFPHREALVISSGVLELAGGVGLLLPWFARSASTCLAVLMVAIFPANVYAANRNVGGLHMPSVPVRLAMQVLYICWLLIAGWGIRPAEPELRSTERM